MVLLNYLSNSWGDLLIIMIKYVTCVCMFLKYIVALTFWHGILLPVMFFSFCSEIVIVDPAI